MTSNNSGVQKLATLHFLADSGDYSLKSTVALNKIRTSPELPAFNAEKDQPNHFLVDALELKEFLFTKCDVTLLQHLLSLLSPDTQKLYSVEELEGVVPDFLQECTSKLLAKPAELFTLERLNKIGEESRSELSSILAQVFENHILSRDSLKNAKGSVSAVRAVEGLRLGDVIPVTTHGKPVLGIITEMELDYHQSGYVLYVTTSSLGPAYQLAGEKFAWHSILSEFPLHQSIKDTSKVRPVEVSAMKSADASRIAKTLLECVNKPFFRQVPTGTTGWIKRGRELAPAPLSGRVIVDCEGFSLNSPMHGQTLTFKEDVEHTANALLADGDARLGEHLERMAAFVNPFVFAFCLNERRWAMAPADALSTVDFTPGLMDKLVVEDSVKAMLLSLTRMFTNKGATSRDFIQGKAGGNVFMLHGPSGIGKTLTAEATAEELKRPLYKISAASLGTTPEDIQIRLERALSNSERWGAVTLLDEADIYLEKRNSSDIIRNAIVGVFLQSLEYYGGVLFVTTNRVTNIDPAILPRISLGFGYPQLDKVARVSVWNNLLGLQSLAFSEAQVDELASHEFNGRQIKNVVNLATSICEAAEHSSIDDKFNEFRNMALATSKFLDSTKASDTNA